MSLDLCLSLAGLAISTVMAAAILAASLRPEGRQAFLAFVFLEAAVFFAGALADRLFHSAFASAACSYCGSLFGLPSLYLFARSTAERVDRRAFRHYLPALANLPLGLAMAALGATGKGGLPVALYYLALVAAQTTQLLAYGRRTLALARGQGRARGADWLLRATQAVVAAYALVTAMSWAIILATAAEEILGRPLDPFPWIDPLSVLVAFFLAWTLGLCVLWNRDRASASADKAEARKYGGRPLSASEAGALVGRVRALVEAEADLSSDAVQPRALANRLGVPYYILSRAVNEGAGMSVLDLVNGCRVERAKAILARRPDASVIDACFEAGFSAKSTFNEVFRKSVGMTPRQYRDSACHRPLHEYNRGGRPS